MTWLRVFGFRLLALFRPQRFEARLSEEVSSHLAMLAEEHLRRGIPEQEARYAALRSFGGVEQTKESHRDRRGFPAIDSLVQDLRYGVRQLRRTPGFTAIAILTLALGIGANTAIFSVVYAVLLKPLPFLNAEQLVAVFEANQRAGVKANGCSYPEFEQWRKQNHAFSGMAGVQGHELTLTGHGLPAVVRVGDVTSDFFSVLGVPPLAGRAFVAADGKEGAAPVVVIGEGLWRSRFAASTNLIGSMIDLDKRPFTVIGIMPGSFLFSFDGSDKQLWIPINQDPLFGAWTKRQGGHWLTVVARLKPGISAARGQAEMGTLGQRLTPEYRAQDPGWEIRTASLRKALTGDAEPALLMLLAAVGLVLLIACANVANLLLARATSRAREFGVRAALGAGKGRILRQLFTESALLSLVGAGIGIGVAYWGVRSLSGLLPPAFPRAESIRVDEPVLLFALFTAFAASLLFGLGPALFAADSRLQRTLQESAGRISGDGRRRRARNFLVSAEVALATVLLIGAGLLIRSFAALLSVKPGFDTQHILKAEISLPQFQYSKPEQWVAFSHALLTRIQEQPDLRDSSIAVPLPLADGFVDLGFSIANRPRLPEGRSNSAHYVAIGPGYFHVMSIPLLAGRYFDRQDSASSTRVAIISQELARMYFPDRDPLGQELIFGFPPNGNVKRRIVGVVGDVRDTALRQPPKPMMYVPFDQAPFWGVGLVVKTQSSAAAASRAILDKVHEVDRDLPVTGIQWMSQAVDSSLAQTRLRTWLIGLFGSVALALAMAGIFGVISYSVSRRTQEFGIRMALGAAGSEITRLVLKEAIGLVLAGALTGLILALVLTRLIAALLFGVQPADPATLIFVPLLLTAAALFAAYLPARRATAVDPVTVLRHE